MSKSASRGKHRSNRWSRFSSERLGESAFLGLVPGRELLWPFWGRGRLLPASGCSWMTPEHHSQLVMEIEVQALCREHLVSFTLCYYKFTSVSWQEEIRGRESFQNSQPLLCVAFVCFCFLGTHSCFKKRRLASHLWPILLLLPSSDRQTVGYHHSWLECMFLRCHYLKRHLIVISRLIFI